MASHAEPLLARDRPASQANSTDTEERGIEEEDALLTGQRTGKQDSPILQHARSKWREIALFVWAVIATAAVIVLAVVWQHGRAENHHTGGGHGSSRFAGKRNLIFMVSDGMGPTSLGLTRSWRQHVEQIPFDQTLVLDDYLVGQSRTRSTSSLITDSAAGATAFSCARKSYNGAISVLPSFEPCGSVMEAAKRAGYTTGLVVTTRITDATPAVFVSHVRKREMEDEIARQMTGEAHPLGRMLDFMMGGGRCHFLPNSTAGSCRKDDIDVIGNAKADGWNYIETREEFDNIGTFINLPSMGLFASRDIPYEIDRREESDVFPSLEEMTTAALKVLSAATAHSEKGFFIMIEGSRIDHAGHGNDPAAQVHEVLAYDKAMTAVLDFIDRSTTPTLMVSTSDHETGGLATARQLHDAYPRYAWYPGVLANVSHSASYASRAYNEYLSLAVDASTEDMTKYLTSLSASALGVHDCSSEELATLIARPRIASYTFADMVSRRAQTGWSTHGHSGADVNIYASDRGATKALAGNHENTEVGKFLREFLELDKEVESVTEDLRAHMQSLAGEAWLGDVPDADERLDGQDHLDHYTGDHKRSSGICDD